MKAPETRPFFNWISAIQKATSHKSISSGLAECLDRAKFLGLVFASVASATPASAQGVLTNGYTALGTIASAGITNQWTFSAKAGDSIVIRAGIMSPTNTSLRPLLQLSDPNGVSIGSSAGTQIKAAEVTATATNTGTFNLSLTALAAIKYRVTLADVPGEVANAPGSAGGAMLNGYTYIGTILTGELDVWNFSASSGDAIVVRMGNATNATSFGCQVRLFNPSGKQLGKAEGNNWAEIAMAATNTGIFTVIVGSEAQTLGAVGDYRLTLLKSPGAISVAPGREGGPITNGVPYLGTIPEGALDSWEFGACDGDLISFTITQTGGSTIFEPSVRLYSPSGALLTTAAPGTTNVAFSVLAPSLGTYRLLIGERSAGAPNPDATYELIGFGIANGLTLCRPLMNGTNLNIRAIGGTGGSNCVLLTSTNVALPTTNWTSIGTNQFDQLGNLIYTNISIEAEAAFFKAQSR